MNPKVGTKQEGPRSLDQIAAELTEAAYAVALHHVKKGSWVDLELGIWRVLAAKLKTWEQCKVGLGKIGLRKVGLA
jgi:hypothetical protein